MVSTRNMRLRNRAKYPPGGFRFRQSETNWTPTTWASFDDTVAQIIAHRNGNPWLIHKNGWSVDPQTVANELDQFNTKVCQEMNWTEYIVDGDPGLYPGIVIVDAPPPPRKLLTKCCGQK